MALKVSPYGFDWLIWSNSLSSNFANKKTSMARSTFKVLFYVNGSKEKITTQKLDNDLTLFGDKLSKTFNGITMS